MALSRGAIELSAVCEIVVFSWSYSLTIFEVLINALTCLNIVYCLAFFFSVLQPSCCRMSVCTLCPIGWSVV